MPLTAEQQRAALSTLVSWRANGQPPPCPACGQAGLAVIDRSARPHAEWYEVSCAACGLNETLHIPLGVSTPAPD
jgi:predicted RNA-binding Zn-ribbon protein involved in translation (DUF1610 family)